MNRYIKSWQMSRKPKLQDVAEMAGVSRATVSQVLNQRGRISDQTRKRVKKAVEALGYVPDTRAASMRSGDNREVGVVIHGLANPFNAEVISGVTNELETHGYLVSTLDSDDDPARQIRNLKAFIGSSRGGLIWVPAIATATDAVTLLEAHAIPTVTLLRDPPVASFDHVGIENEAATATATAHLADLGHRHIAFFGGDTELRQVRNERIAGYLAEMRRRDLGPTVIWPSGDTKSAGLEAAIALRDAHPEITALVCNGDMVALGACLACQRMGIGVGRDLSIVGFDDTEEAAIATPALTTMSVSPRLLGRKLARMLLDRLADPAMPSIRTTVSAKLVIRDSTGAPTANA